MKDTIELTYLGLLLPLLDHFSSRAKKVDASLTGYRPHIAAGSPAQIHG
ncbi:hypothetical protein [Xanthomonas vasicola]|nr:hypothetical protein [Xanthomonas vasicola]